MRPAAARDAPRLRRPRTPAPSAAVSRSNDAGRIVTLLPGREPCTGASCSSARTSSRRRSRSRRPPRSPTSCATSTSRASRPERGSRPDHERALARRRHAGPLPRRRARLGRARGSGARSRAAGGRSGRRHRRRRERAPLRRARRRARREVEPARSRGDRPGVEIAPRALLENVLVTPRSWGLAAASREDGPWSTRRSSRRRWRAHEHDADALPAARRRGGARAPGRARDHAPQPRLGARAGRARARPRSLRLDGGDPRLVPDRLPGRGDRARSPVPPAARRADAGPARAARWRCATGRSPPWAGAGRPGSSSFRACRW